MTYHIIFRKRATKEYLQSIQWYKDKSVKAAQRFIEAVNSVLDKLENEPDVFRNSYKHFKEAAVKRYPFFIIYFIDEVNKRIVITSVFHVKRNPSKKHNQ